MPHYDRLTTLINRFRLSVRSAAPEASALAVTLNRDGTPATLMFRPFGTGFDKKAQNLLFTAAVEWSGAANPLLAALPDCMEINLGDDPVSRDIVMLMQIELQAQRCGAEPVISRLGEVLIVRMLRASLEAGATEPGLLAGRSDPRISRAIVAIHDNPGHPWTNRDLAQIAGLSISRFADMFPATVGEPPAAYLRRWRMTLARQDVDRGDRVEAIARRYGYGSAEGFARAFRKQFGENPVALRPRVA